MPRARRAGDRPGDPATAPEIPEMKNFYSLPGRDCSEGGPILGAGPRHPLEDFSACFASAGYSVARS
jgi:hypothetical protein